MQIREKIFNCSDMQIMYFILDKIMKLLKHAFLPLILCKLISSQKLIRFFGQPYTTHWRPPGMETLTSIQRHGQFDTVFFSFFCFLCKAHRVMGVFTLPCEMSYAILLITTAAYRWCMTTLAVSDKRIPEWLFISRSLQDWGLVYWEAACQVWSLESCVTAARCSCAHVLHWKVTRT